MEVVVHGTYETEDRAYAVAERLWREDKRKAVVYPVSRMESMGLEAPRTVNPWCVVAEKVTDFSENHSPAMRAMGVQATIAKLRQIAADADKKNAELVERGLTGHNSQYYGGMRDGLLRAISVVEGRG